MSLADYITAGCIVAAVVIGFFLGSDGSAADSVGTEGHGGDGGH